MKRYIPLIIAVFALLVAPVRAQETRPAPTVSVEQDGITVSLYFNDLQQGRAGLIQVSGDNLTGVRASFLDGIVPFFPIGDEGWYGLLAVGMGQAVNTYDLALVALMDGTSTTFNIEIPVTNGAFIRETLTIGPERVFLVSPEVERGEFARLDAIDTAVTEEILWDENGFALPINSELTSPFGSFRVFNDSTESRHTGWDLRATTGVPINAMGAGRVAFAGLLDIRGNHVIVDHGYGVFSGYSHMSQVHVTQGQRVSAGQVLGVVGNTGRSGGAHLHWEVMVNGYFVDSADFVEMWIPFGDE